MHRKQSTTPFLRHVLLGQALLTIYLTGLMCSPLSAQTLNNQWRYTLEAPGDGWTQPDFDDSNWKLGSGGFGTSLTPNARIGTEWNTPDIWLRQTIMLDAVPEKPALWIHHDEDAEVFINGRQAAKLAGFTKQYEIHPAERARMPETNRWSPVATCWPSTAARREAGSISTSK